MDERRPRPLQAGGSSARRAEEIRRQIHDAPPSAPSRRVDRGERDRAASSARRAGQPARAPSARAESRTQVRRGSVEANGRLTAQTAVVLLVLLAVEGLTILQIRPMLSVHVFVGMLLIPPVLLKIASTTWRFAKYYLGDPEYRRKGPPLPALRLIGPVVVLLTLVVLFSGVALLLASPSSRPALLFVHQAGFVLWILVMAVHVLGHLLDTAKLAPRDFYWRTRRQVAGASTRQWLVAATLVVGLIAGAVLLPHVGSWVAGGAPAAAHARVAGPAG